MNRRIPVSKRVENLLRKNRQNVIERFSNEEITKILLNLDNIDEDFLYSQLINEWDNIYLLKFIEDLFDIIYMYSQKSGNVEETYRYYLHVEKILGQGAQGIVSAGDFNTDSKNKNPLFAIKNTKDVQNTDDLIREYVVGRELDKFNDPVFTRMYSLFPCSHVLSVNKEPVSFCQTNKEYSIGFQLLQGKPLKDVALTTGEFEIIFIILLSSLYKSSKYQFTHNDLHNENVFVRKLDKPVLVEVELPGSSITYIKTNYFPYILDYGLARIVTKEGSIHPRGYEEFGVRDVYAPMHDIFKFLFFTLEGAPNLGIEHLMNIFVPDLKPSNSRMFIKAERVKNTFFVVPEGLRNITLEEYIIENLSHLEKHSYRDDISSYHIVGNYKNVDYFEFYDLLSENLPTNTFEDKIANTFENNYYNFDDEIGSFDKSLVGLYNKLNEHRIKDMNESTFEKLYYKYTDKLRSLSDHYTRINLKLDALKNPNKNKLNKFFTQRLNNIGTALLAWDRHFKNLIRTKKILNVQSAVYQKRSFT